MGLFGPPDIEKLKAKKDVPGLIKALRYQKDDQVRMDAAHALGQIGDPRAVEPLIAALGDKNKDVRSDAVQALYEIGDPRAVEPLIAALKDADNYVLWAASEALGKIGDIRAVEPLIAVLKDADYNTRYGAATALGKISDVRALDPLIAALKDEDNYVRCAASEALGQMGFPRAVEPLITALCNDSINVRKVAAVALTTLGWKPDKSTVGATYWAMMGKWNRCIQIGALAVEPLIFVLMDNNSVDMETRLAAAKALGRISDPSTVGSLITALGNRDVEIRLAAVHALGMMGDPSAIMPLINTLRDKNDQVRKAAKQALSKINNAQAVETLISALKDQDVFVRKSATQALHRIGKPAIEPLIANLGDQVWYVREAAVEALDKLRWRPDNDAHKAAYWVAKQKWDHCIKIGAPSVEPLILALQHENLLVRAAAIRALGEIGDPHSVVSLITALGESDNYVREVAVEALERLGWQPDEGPHGAAYWIAKQAWDRCFQIGSAAQDPLITALSFWPWEMRFSAASYLEKLGWQPDEGPHGAAYWIAKENWGRCIQIGTPAVEPLIKAVTRIGAIQALGKIGDHRAVEPLIKALGDFRSNVRKAAAEALVELYQAGTLPADLKNLVLENRIHITTRHADHETHEDQNPPSDCHFDESKHHDSGIGVPFPV